MALKIFEDKQFFYDKEGVENTYRIVGKGDEVEESNDGVVEILTRVRGGWIAKNETLANTNPEDDV